MDATDPGFDSSIYDEAVIDADGEIRLLLLQSGQAGDSIHCSLVAYQRKQAFGIYEALSYTWGPSIHKKTITVNGHQNVPVTDNLFAALRRLRFKRQPRILWVDAICIHQRNSIERSVQVQHIRDVYSNAKQVLVWLGDSNKMESIAVERLQSDLCAMASEWQRGSLHQAVHETMPRWWERVWVWQEFAAARKPPVICFGRLEAHWEDFNRLAFSIHQDRLGPNELSPSPRPSKSGSRKGSTGSQIDLLDSLTDCLTHLESLRSDSGFINRPFSEMVRKTINAKATDSRDKIFSLVGFLKPRDAEILKPDYTKSHEAVCAAGTYAYMLETDMTTALSWVQLDSTRTASATVPTWAINFGSPPEIGQTETWFRRFNCTVPGIERQVDEAKSPVFDWSTLSITLQGIRFDRIERVIKYPLYGLSQICDELWIGLETENLDEDNDACDDARDQDPWKLVSQRQSADILALIRLVLSVRGNSPYRIDKWHRQQDLEDRTRSFSLVPNDYHSFSAQPRTETEAYKTKLELRRSAEQQWENEVQDWKHEREGDSEFADRWAKFHRKSDISKLFTIWSRCAGFTELEHATNYRIFHEAWIYYAHSTARQPVIFTTSKGFVGVGPDSILEGDIVTLSSEIRVPMVLRDFDECHLFQGLCHVHGIMYGELSHICSDVRCEEFPLEIR